jgi:hypothetical protein
VSRNHRALVLPSEYHNWEAAYAATLVDAGLQVDHTWRWGARAFCARFGDGRGWHALSLEQQLALNPKILRFVGWAIATHRVRPTAAYLIARRAHQGNLLARIHPLMHANFAATAVEIGYASNAAEKQWAALGLVCALVGLDPPEIRQHHIDQARVELVAAARTFGRGGALRSLQTGLFGAEAVLFHAGISDQLPRRHCPTKVAERAAAWAKLGELAPTLATTMQRYLEQLALSLRPGTVGNAKGALREFSTFVIAEDPTVRRTADLLRRHLEAYKR